jgi:hypothetical protein
MRISWVCAGLAAAIALSVCRPSALAQGWNPPAPPSDGKDWVQLKSGEWLRGKIEVFRDLVMEFDSDELEELELDWEDIRAFRTAGAMTFVFSDDRIATGKATMSDGVILISTIEGNPEFDRRQLLSIIEGSPREIDFWSIIASVGTTVRSGNTDEGDFEARIKTKREAKLSRLTLEYQGDVSAIDGEETANTHMGRAIANLFLSPRLYLTPWLVEIYSDRFQNIDYRTTFGAGVGYFIFRQSRIEWSVGIGGGYQSTYYLSVEPGEEGKENTGSAIPSTALEADITKDIELRIDYKAQVGIPDPKSSTISFDLVLSIDFLKDIFELNLTTEWDHTENPKTYEDGTVPEQDDLKLMLGFGIDM